MEHSWPRIAVLIPTYRRGEDLKRCLEAVRQQVRPADQIVVVIRPEDLDAQLVLTEFNSKQLIVVHVASPGVVAALNAGLVAVQADVVAFTDDDAAPRPDWLQRIAEHFRKNPRLGGVGGRDWIFQHGRPERGAKRVVGVITWYGRCIGNHHLGIGPIREVDALKGVNMSFRVGALEGIRFDERLRGTGAQVFNELGVSLAVKRKGWQLLYDPELAVDHYPSVRHDEDRRNHFSRAAVSNAAYNETLLLAEHLTPLRRLFFMFWALLVGTHSAPGLVNWLRLLVIERRTATARFLATISGRFSGWGAGEC
jgi:GT2 family glycosyltransferase